MFKTGIPPDLTQKHFIALCADLRGSRKTGKYKDKYDECVKDFQEVAKKVIVDDGRCLCKPPHSFEGETLKVLFSNPWSDIAAISAIYSAIGVHQAVSTAGFNCHGVSIGLNWGNNDSDAFADAMYLINFIGKEHPTPPYDSKILITEKVFSFLPASCQRFFKNIGNKNIAKRETDEPIQLALYELNTNETDILVAELRSFFDLGLIAVLPNGLWPKLTGLSSGDYHFFKHLIDTSSSEIKILQTYMPGFEIIKDNLKKAIDRSVEIQVLLLQKKWRVSDEIKKLFREIIKPNVKGEFNSPLAYQRGKDFKYKRPLQFSSEIDTCQTALDNLKGGLYKFYDATPSACLHIFDNVMFVGSFLQGSFAVTTPHLALVKGSNLFSRFMEEFKRLWS